MEYKNCHAGQMWMAPCRRGRERQLESIRNAIPPRDRSFCNKASRCASAIPPQALGNKPDSFRATQSILP